MGLRRKFRNEIADSHRHSRSLGLKESVQFIESLSAPPMHFAVSSHQYGRRLLPSAGRYHGRFEKSCQLLGENRKFANPFQNLAPGREVDLLVAGL
jgi:hypothetical protein